MNPTKLAITLPDYERIFRTIHGVLLNEKGDPSRACLHFAVIGAAIMEKYHRIKAQPVVGMAAYRLDSTFLVFGEQDAFGLSAATNGYHSWIEANGVAIDFQAPLFKDIVSERSSVVVLPRKMMQKRLNEGSASLSSMESSGTHWYEPDHQLREELLSNFLSMPANMDFVQICLQWYRPAPKNIKASITIANQHGRIDNVPLSPLRINGAW